MAMSLATARMMAQILLMNYTTVEAREQEARYCRRVECEARGHSSSTQLAVVKTEAGPSGGKAVLVKTEDSSLIVYHQAASLLSGRGCLREMMTAQDVLAVSLLCRLVAEEPRRAPLLSPPQQYRMAARVSAEHSMLETLRPA